MKLITTRKRPLTPKQLLDREMRSITKTWTIKAELRRRYFGKPMEDKYYIREAMEETIKNHLTSHNSASCKCKRQSGDALLSILGLERTKDSTF